MAIPLREGVQEAVKAALANGHLLNTPWAYSKGTSDYMPPTQASTTGTYCGADAHVFLSVLQEPYFVGNAITGRCSSSKLHDDHSKLSVVPEVMATIAFMVGDKGHKLTEWTAHVRPEHEIMLRNRCGRCNWTIAVRIDKVGWSIPEVDQLIVNNFCGMEPPEAKAARLARQQPAQAQSAEAAEPQAQPASLFAAVYGQSAPAEFTETESEARTTAAGQGYRFVTYQRQPHRGD